MSSRAPALRAPSVASLFAHSSRAAIRLFVYMHRSTSIIESTLRHHRASSSSSLSSSSSSPASPASSSRAQQPIDGFALSQRRVQPFPPEPSLKRPQKTPRLGPTRPIPRSLLPSLVHRPSRALDSERLAKRVPERVSPESRAEQTNEVPFRFLYRSSHVFGAREIFLGELRARGIVHRDRATMDGVARRFRARVFDFPILDRARGLRRPRRRRRVHALVIDEFILGIDLRVEVARGIARGRRHARSAVHANLCANRNRH